ncbi:hypothetical protein C8R44DRAFT_973971, partial [Mycena epipterygia]
MRRNREIRVPVERIRDLLESNPASFFHDHVRHLSLDTFKHSINEIMPVIAVCDATVDIQFFFGCPELLPLLGALPLQRLSARLADLFPDPSGPDFAHPIFTNITHLGIRDTPGHGFDTWTGLAKIPRLTHLSFHYYGIDYPSYPISALLQRKSLEVLAISFSHGVYLHHFASDYATVAIDPRLVMLEVPNVVDDWNVGARGGDDRWVKANKLVRLRHSREVQ